MKISLTQLNSVVLISLLSVLAMKPVASVPAEHNAVLPPEQAPAILPYHARPVSIGDASGYAPPDFQAISDIAARKAAFYDYLLPMIHKANDEVLKERAWLVQVAKTLAATRTISDANLVELERVEARYLRKRPEGTVVERVRTMLGRVDVVPASLVLAQAAKESGWGTSRFATQGNNFFGIWCFSEGCGLTPLGRAEGRDHEVATFATVEEGVRYYIRNINTHAAYKELRSMRAQARTRNERLRGVQMAEGLVRYSERGADYVKEIQTMIHYNQLARFTLNQKV